MYAMFRQLMQKLRLNYRASIGIHLLWLVLPYRLCLESKHDRSGKPKRT